MVAAIVYGPLPVGSSVLDLWSVAAGPRSLAPPTAIALAILAAPPTASRTPHNNIGLGGQVW
ncbi:hypothetical protein M413DRAFT_450143 [Hebeloma cylindrosporum]|uniref:Uncharacterized protein n=1 Tax=Hebeloma cylindrosporum TaxID=76867 RepID=A0A0C3BTF6_HEBCY|nr:hypothetical protein M413DRAFT_450143 [Hebeloma cylindrosporum h7]